jgi:hypothetical protein
VLIVMAASRGRTYPRMAGAPLWLFWLTMTVLLVAGFCVLEGLEIVFEPHHPDGVAGIFGDGGWWALPAAAFAGALMALLARGGRLLLVIATRARESCRVPTIASQHPRLARCSTPPSPMASCAAGRAPPLTALAS